MNKYRNITIIFDNIKFHSKKEGFRYLELKRLFKIGKITELELQKKFVLIDEFKDYQGRKETALHYIADFTYKDDKGVYTVEDVKGMKTEVYRIKKKLFLLRYSHKFIET